MGLGQHTGHPGPAPVPAVHIMYGILPCTPIYYTMMGYNSRQLSFITGMLAFRILASAYCRCPQQDSNTRHSSSTEWHGADYGR